MKIYNRKDFLKLPAGIIFAKGQPFAFDEIQVKGDSLENDFFSREWTWISAHDSGEAMARLDEMLERGASYAINDAEGRDGLFDDNDIFLVFEPEDLQTMRQDIDAAVEAFASVYNEANAR
ncbi:hypothetical protein LJR231_002241 [Phyllobacterium sp. LjRoot231]|uniref:hypothetical protein n=1 Tax=Phyllobacterium sp. LjRoot231 TaxID=3342289 RepID=UPI003ECF2074